jgi:hypothetical protein
MFESNKENVVDMIMFDIGNNEYDVEPFNKMLGPTMEPYSICTVL